MWIPKRVWWSPLSMITDFTNKCNSNCIMCRTQLLKKEELSWSYSNFLTVMNNFHPRSVALGGTGEIYLNKNLGQAVIYLNNKGIKSIVNTNGILIDSTKDWIKKVDLFKISLDACTPELYKTIRRNNNFEKIISNIRELRKLKIPVRLEYVIMSINYKQMSHFIKFAKSLDVDVFFRLFQGNKLPDNPNFDFYDVPKLNDELIVATLIAKKLGVTSNLPDLCKKLRYIKQVYAKEKIVDDREKHVCLLPWLQFFVRVDGETSPCCNLLELSGVSTGNIFKEITQRAES